MDQVIINRPCVGTTARILQNQHLRFSRVTTTSPMLIVVKAGRKELRAPGFECVLEAGDVVAIAADSVLDITNTPDASGQYAASWLVWDAALISSHKQLNPQSSVVHRARHIGQASDEFTSSIDAAMDALHQGAHLPVAVAIHRLCEVLVWLDILGSRFELKEPTTVRAIVRRQIMSAPEANWTAPAIAANMAMSEATLRRRLSSDGTTVADLVVDVRMSLAMQLLQSTHLSISRIALEVGYESASRFAIRFRHRFGFPPSAIRGHQRAEVVVAQSSGGGNLLIKSPHEGDAGHKRRTTKASL